jgi:tRNA(adenine34) deaminase
MLDEPFMQRALELARLARDRGEVPVGAVLVRDGTILCEAGNEVEGRQDATAHAEMLAIGQAQALLKTWRLTGTTLYVTKEPCPMCAGALAHVRVDRIVYGVGDPKAGACGGAFDLFALPGLNHRCEITPGVLATESLRLLQDFFRDRRAGEKYISSQPVNTSMPTSPIPDQHHTVAPYLIVDGAERLINFVTAAFAGEVIEKLLRADGRIGHAQVKIGDSILMLSDTTSSMSPITGMIHLYVPDADAVFQKALAAGATTIMPVTDQFYGDRSGGVKDDFGILWWISTHVKDIPEDELQQLALVHMRT